MTCGTFFGTIRSGFITMELQRIQTLIAKYLDGNTTPEESREVENWYAMIQEESPLSAFNDANREQEYERLISRILVPKKPKLLRIYWYVGWAAAVIILLSVMIWPVINKKNGGSGLQNVELAGVAEASREHIVFTFGNGHRINIDQQKNGILQPENGLRLNVDSGRLAIEKLNLTEKLVWHSLTTPFRRKYIVDLPDGSRIWLNASSSVRFPNNFGNAKQRILDLTGEAYFEVSHQENAGRAKPFIVRVAGEEINVLGTHFNVNAYGDRFKVVTTLFEGSVSVKEGATHLVLLPGEAAVTSKGGVLQRDVKVNLDAAQGWRRSVFIFERSDLREILDQFSHWYGLAIVYKTTPSGTVFSGKIPMDLDIQQALQIVEQPEIQFRVDSGKIYVEARKK